jgi:uncharacterized membrane protein YgcG
MVLDGHLLPSVDSTWDLGTSSLQWRSLHVAGSTIYIGGVTLSTYEDSIVVNSLLIGSTESNFLISSDDQNINVSGDLLVQGNLIVNGTTSTINTENLIVKDPLILLASEQVGTPTYDAGILINRGFGVTQAFIWDESEDTFVLISTTQSSLEKNISISEYSDLRLRNINLESLLVNTDEGTLSVSGIDIIATGFDNIVMTSSVFDVVSNFISLDSTDALQILADNDITISANGQLALTGESGLVSIGNTQGLVYQDDYSSGFVNRSLVDKEYVDNAILVGTSGSSGSSGTSGSSGSSGSSGTSGSSGSSGTSGAVGTSGTSGTTPTSDLSLSSLTVSGTSSLNGLTVLQGVTEVINSTPGATASTVVYDFSTGANWYHSSANTNYTANFTNIPTTDNRVTTVTIVINQGATAYIPTAVQIGGTPSTIKWAGGTASGTTNQVDIVGFTFIRSGGSWAQVLGQINTFD